MTPKKTWQIGNHRFKFIPFSGHLYHYKRIGNDWWFQDVHRLPSIVRRFV